MPDTARPEELAILWAMGQRLGVKRSSSRSTTLLPSGVPPLLFVVEKNQKNRFLAWRSRQASGVPIGRHGHSVGTVWHRPVGWSSGPGGWVKTSQHGLNWFGAQRGAHSNLESRQGACRSCPLTRARSMVRAWACQVVPDYCQERQWPSAV